LSLSISDISGDDARRNKRAGRSHMAWQGVVDNGSTEIAPVSGHAAAMGCGKARPNIPQVAMSHLPERLVTILPRRFKVRADEGEVDGAERFGGERGELRCINCKYRPVASLTKNRTQDTASD
jgi:hypothetical protein